MTIWTVVCKLKTRIDVSLENHNHNFYLSNIVLKGYFCIYTCIYDTFGALKISNVCYEK